MAACSITLFDFNTCEVKCLCEIYCSKDGNVPGVFGKRKETMANSSIAQSSRPKCQKRAASSPGQSLQTSPKSPQSASRIHSCKSQGRYVPGQVAATRRPQRHGRQTSHSRGLVQAQYDVRSGQSMAQHDVVAFPVNATIRNQSGVGRTPNARQSPTLESGV